MQTKSCDLHLLSGQLEFCRSPLRAQCGVAQALVRCRACTGRLPNPPCCRPGCYDPGGRRRAGIKVGKLRPAVEGLTSAGSVSAEVILSILGLSTIAGYLALAFLSQQQGISPIWPCSVP